MRGTLQKEFGVGFPSAKAEDEGALLCKLSVSWKKAFPTRVGNCNQVSIKTDISEKSIKASYERKPRRPD